MSVSVVHHVRVCHCVVYCVAEVSKPRGLQELHDGGLAHDAAIDTRGTTHTRCTHTHNHALSNTTRAHSPVTVLYQRRERFRDSGGGG